MPERTLSTVGNAIRALTVLADLGPLRLTALADELKLGKSTVHLLLQTLREHGMVDYDPATRTYGVGLRVFELGATAVERGGFGARLVGPMEELARRCNESVSLGVLNAGSVLIVQRIESPEILRADIRPGTRMPLHASASGKALLATMADLEIDRLLSESPLPDSARMTHRQRNGLLADIRLIRKRGYAKQKEEFVDGISAVATPVLTAGGRALAALSIASPSSRFDEVRWSALLLPAASYMSELCGYRAQREEQAPNGAGHMFAGTGANAVPRRKEDRPSREQAMSS
ncbi:MAG TPA: IclR family transcriptional regulator [Thermomicrobiales bacterium]|nr:IclR family transcriptional regulator [Thermomicrobiales bacterium]